MMRRALGPLLLVACAAATMRAQDAAPLPAALATVADSAVRAGVRRGPLEAKAWEGIRKGAPEARIAGVLREQAVRLAQAEQAIGARASDAEVAAAAEALRAGLAVADLRSLRLAAGEQSLLVPCGVLTQLLARGVAAPRALDAMRTLLLRRAADRQFVQVGSGVEAEAARGGSASLALDRGVRGISVALPAGGGGTNPADRTSVPMPGGR
ncbi:MAG: hypothetical protein NW201_12925 [Gemmatimonadales bacterium]|nr:hypothetical protein [Gemmatimonadales bacterium]